MQPTPHTVNIEQLELLAIDRWYDLDRDTAARISTEVPTLSDTELLQHPILAVSALVAECSLAAHRSPESVTPNPQDPQSQLWERIATLVESLPTTHPTHSVRCRSAATQSSLPMPCDRCKNTTEHWRLLRMMVYRWRQHLPAAVISADELNREHGAGVAPTGCVSPTLRSTLETSRPGLLALQRSITYAFAGNWATALELSVRASRCGGTPPRSHYAAVNATAIAALVTSVIGLSEQSHAWIERASDSPAVPDWCSPYIHVGAEIAQAQLRCDQGTVLASDHCVTQVASLLEHSELWPFAAHVLTEVDLNLGHPCQAIQRLQTLTLSRNTDVRESSLLGGLLLRDYCDTLLQLGEGNLLLRTLESRNPSVHTHIPAAHLWLRAADPLRAQLHATRALRTPNLTRRDTLEAQLLCAAAAVMQSDRLTALQRLRFCAAEIARDFPILLNRIPEETAAGLRELAPHTLGQLPPLPNRGDYSELQLVRLTPREQRILEQLALGLTPQLIAQADVVSLHTVRTQLKMLYRKLNARSAAESVSRASSLGLLRSDDPAPLASGI